MCCIRLRVCYTSAALCSAAVIRMLQAQARFPNRRSRLRLRMAATVPAQTSVVCELLSVTECPEKRVSVIMVSWRQIVSALTPLIILQLSEAASIPAQYRFSYRVRKWRHSATLSQDLS